MKAANHRAVALLLVLSATASGTSRFSGEKGARAHRTTLAAAESTVCAIAADGSVNCWGGTVKGVSDLPVAMAVGGPAVSIATGFGHACAIMAISGAVRCWGQNGSGQLGNGSPTTSLVVTPVTVTGLTKVTSIAAGLAHTCAVRVDGTVWCWGLNDSGQLGNGSLVKSAVPTQVKGLTGAVSVVAGHLHTCALLEDGRVSCWGTNGGGELGNNSGITRSEFPQFTQPVSNVPGVVAVELVAQSTFTCARLSDGSMSCWGLNSNGQFGNGTFNAVATAPVASKVSPGVVAFAAGNEHLCVILVDGTASCWGNGANGANGDGTSLGRTLPGPPVQGVADAVEIAAGNQFACAAIVDGTIRCWGDNQFGEHGNQTTAPSGTDSVIGIAGNALARGVTAGNRYTCGRRNNGDAACWGSGTHGQLGDSASTTSPAPVAVTSLSRVLGLSAGTGSHTCAVDTRGSIECWGNNSHGQLGNGTTTDSNQPVTVKSQVQFVAVAAGDLHTCAITVTGIILCWGANDRGQLGNGSTVDSSVPVRAIGVISGAVAITTGNKFSCALIADGSARCWGDNTSDQLGDGGAEPFASSMQSVPGLAGIVGMAAGAAHACAVTASGTALCWGDNSRGQIGNNSTQRATLPTTVANLTDATTISAGGLFTCAGQAGGVVSCWGANDSGQLSTTDSLDHFTPSPVGHFVFCSNIVCGNGSNRIFVPIQTAVAVATGTRTSTPDQEHACMADASGHIFCWGDNSQGEIGDGSTLNASHPTEVISFVAQ
jgi:alpha-tubulin suppressor-like RCC1 family protein